MFSLAFRPNRKIPFSYICILVMFVLVGCSPITTNKTLSSKDVLSLLKNQKVDMVKGNEKYFELIATTPINYKVKNDNIFVYVFQSIEDIEKAVEDFDNQTTLINMQTPLQYSFENILILYLPEQRDKPDEHLSNELTELAF